MFVRLGLVLVFQIGYDIKMPCGFLVGVRETGTHSKRRNDFHVSTFEWRCDNFINIRAIDFLNLPSIFTCPMDVIVYHVCESKQLSHFVDKMKILP